MKTSNLPFYRNIQHFHVSLNGEIPMDLLKEILDQALYCIADSHYTRSVIIDEHGEDHHLDFNLVSDGVHHTLQNFNVDGEGLDWEIRMLIPEDYRLFMPYTYIIVKEV